MGFILSLRVRHPLKSNAKLSLFSQFPIVFDRKQQIGVETYCKTHPLRAILLNLACVQRQFARLHSSTSSSVAP